MNFFLITVIIIIFNNFFLGDDLYLIRLLYITGPPLDTLSIGLAKKLIFRINAIIRSHMVEELIYRLIKQSYDINFFDVLDINFQNELMETLYDLAKFNSNLGVNSDTLYKTIIENYNNPEYNSTL